MIESLCVAKLHDVRVYNGATSRYPFPIKTAINEVVCIYGLAVSQRIYGGDANSTSEYALIQKTERRENGLTVVLPSLRDEDQDILVRGIFNRTTIANGGIAGPYRQYTKFDIPIVIPRCPSFEFYNSIGANTYWNAELYYLKKEVSDKDIRVLLNKWVGRKQTE